MEANTYQRLAMTTLNPALQDRDVLINGVMGLCGEAGEAIDLVKKTPGPGASPGYAPAGPGTGGCGLVPGGNCAGHRLFPGRHPANEPG